MKDGPRWDKRAYTMPDYATDRRARRRKLVRLDELRMTVISQLKKGPLSSLHAATAGHWDRQSRLRADCSIKVKQFVLPGRVLRTIYAHVYRTGTLSPPKTRSVILPC